MIECGALAMATSASRLIEWHRVFKPLTMLVALAVVARHWYGSGQGLHPRWQRVFARRAWLVAALAASLAGMPF